MELISGLRPDTDLSTVGAFARRVERLGYDALHVPEMVSDPFALAALALDATTSLRVRTGVALAFVRSPMATALSAWSLNNAYGDRFSLGLGTQIRQNIEDRYGMAFDRPVDRLADYVAAVRACFASFATGERLDHRGPYYQLTRLQADFRPTGTHAPDIWLGAVGDRMLGLAGRSADGVITHPTNSHPADLAERTVPSIASAAADAGRDAPPLVVSPLVVTGRDTDAVNEARVQAQQRLGFLYSTPAYRPTLDRLGFTGVGSELRQLMQSGRTDDLADAVPDALVDAVCPTAEWTGLAPLLVDWFGGTAHGVVVRPPVDPGDDDDFAGSFVEPLRRLSPVGYSRRKHPESR